MSWLDKLLPGLAGATEPGQMSLDLGKYDAGKGLVPQEYLTRGKQVFKTQPTLNRTLGKFAMGDKAVGLLKNSGKVAGRAVPLFIALDAATELADESDPFQKNLAEGLGKAGGTWGGLAGGAALGAPLGPVGSGVGAILGAILMSDIGKQLAGGAYKVVNPRGELEYAKRQIQKQAEIQKEIDSVNREIARDRARDQQRLAFETAILNAAMGR
jgi:predicted lipid-binding transport protein (Tim44 family)